MTTAHWILKNDEGEILAEFESNIPPSKLQKFLYEHGNLFDKEKFKKYVESFKIIRDKFNIIML